MVRPRIEQRFGILKVRSVKALGEPAVDRGQQLVRIDTLALLLPEPTQTHRRPQLERFGLLPALHVEILMMGASQWEP
jgi:hypothetical protein